MRIEEVSQAVEEELTRWSEDPDEIHSNHTVEVGGVLVTTVIWSSAGVRVKIPARRGEQIYRQTRWAVAIDGRVTASGTVSTQIEDAS